MNMGSMGSKASTACNLKPPPGHPLHGSLVACHMASGHEAPCSWALEPSLARRGLDRLLATFANREIESVDSQPEKPIMAHEVDEHGIRVGEPYELARNIAGPWVLVTFVGGDEFAIWKHTGAVFRVGPDGAVEEDPILEVVKVPEVDGK